MAVVTAAAAAGEGGTSEELEEAVVSDWVLFFSRWSVTVYRAPPRQIDTTHLAVPFVVHLHVGRGGCGGCWLVCHGLPPHASQQARQVG